MKEPDRGMQGQIAGRVSGEKFARADWLIQPKLVRTSHDFIVIGNRCTRSDAGYAVHLEGLKFRPLYPALSQWVKRHAKSSNSRLKI
jgi:hypothetical protein